MTGPAFRSDDVAIRVTCGCGNEFVARDAYAGKVVRCPRCQKPGPVLARNVIPPDPPGMPAALLAIDAADEDDEPEPAGGDGLTFVPLPPGTSSPWFAPEAAPIERAFLRGFLYLALAGCAVNRLTQSGFRGGDLTRESQTVWLVAAVALAGLAASSGRRSG